MATDKLINLITFLDLNTNLIELKKEVLKDYFELNIHSSVDLYIKENHKEFFVNNHFLITTDTYGIDLDYIILTEEEYLKWDLSIKEYYKYVSPKVFTKISRFNKTFYIH